MAKAPDRAVGFGPLFELPLSLTLPRFFAHLFREQRLNETVELACSSSDLGCRSVSVESHPLSAESCHGGAIQSLVLSSDFLLYFLLGR